MHELLWIRTINPNEKFVFMGNRVKVLVEAIRTYRLILNIVFYLDLFYTFYVPNISWNLVSLSKIDVIGYSYRFGNGCLSLYKCTCMIGSSTLYDDLYVKTLMTSHHNVVTKSSLVKWMFCLIVA